MPYAIHARRFFEKNVYAAIDILASVVYIDVDAKQRERDMNPREERGLIIAATCRLNRTDDGTWLVPSQSHETVYRVNLETKACTCLDCTDGGFVCKHYYAASIVHKRDVLPDGTVIETKSITLTERKVTYKQDWPA